MHIIYLSGQLNTHQSLIHKDREIHTLTHICTHTIRQLRRNNTSILETLTFQHFFLVNELINASSFIILLKRG